MSILGNPFKMPSLSIGASRRLRYRVNPDLPLRAETQQDKAIGSLLEVLGWRIRRRQIRRGIAS